MTHSERSGVPPYRYERPTSVAYGEMQTMGGRLVCHLCGRDFLHLGSHIAKTHGMTGQEYRVEFGLMASQRLAAESTRTRNREAATRNGFAELGAANRSRAYLDSIRSEAHAALGEKRAQRSTGSASARAGTLARWHPDRQIPLDECPRGHKWDGALHGTTGYRYCRMCNRENVARWRKEHPDRFEAQRQRRRDLRREQRIVATMVANPPENASATHE